jgi:hypothetical protein
MGFSNETCRFSVLPWDDPREQLRAGGAGRKNSFCRISYIAERRLDLRFLHR